MSDKLIIFDTTLRDGEQSPGASMTKDEKVRIAKVLEKMKVDVIEAGFGLSDLTELEKSMLEFVGNQPMDDVTLTDMVKNDYFSSYSFSTMKRSLVSLLDAGLLVQEINLEDGRKRTLKVAIDNI